MLKALGRPASFSVMMLQMIFHLVMTTLLEKVVKKKKCLKLKNPIVKHGVKSPNKEGRNEGITR